MYTTVAKIEQCPTKSHLGVLFTALEQLEKVDFLHAEEKQYIQQQKDQNKKTFIPLNRLGQYVLVHFIDLEKEPQQIRELCRKAGGTFCNFANDNKLEDLCLLAPNAPELIRDTAEGLVLSNYEFSLYKTQEREQLHQLKNIHIYAPDLEPGQLDELNTINQWTCHARDLVNEPVATLSAEELAHRFETWAQQTGATAEVFNKKRIESLKMGGLLAVNKGSELPPTFTILEWKPENAINDKPYVFVGKGVVYDTGGMNIKTANYMDNMKSDMAGGAAVACAVLAISEARLPVHVVAMVPATDNRPGTRAYVPGDILTMHNGITVEVLNTDAEGRLILADALSYAIKYQPELVIDMATLTGSAHAAIGQYGIVGMGSQHETHMSALKMSGESVYERIVEFPFWEEYAELLKSDVADTTNLGGRVAGAITAGKFLEKFTDYPYIHLDIAGPAFLDKKEGYRGKGGSGIGVRLLFDFIKNKIG